MSASAENFWTGGHKYEDLARTYYENIERDWPAYDYVTSRRMCPCLEHFSRCSFPLEGKVVRINYRGTSVTNI